MSAITVIILTKNRASFLRRALDSVLRQTFTDFEVVVVNDGSTDGTDDVLKEYSHLNIQIIKHEEPAGIVKSRQEALEKSQGEFIAILDDDDEWVDSQKLQKQIDYFYNHPDAVLVGGGRMDIIPSEHVPSGRKKFRTEKDSAIRKTMLLRNNFFTSTVLFKRESALRAGGFIQDGIDLAEDYDLWLRMGSYGSFYNFSEVFTAYTLPRYNKEKFKLFLSKQLQLIRQHRHDYPYYLVSWAILHMRIFFLDFTF